MCVFLTIPSLAGMVTVVVSAAPTVTSGRSVVVNMIVKSSSASTTASSVANTFTQLEAGMAPADNAMVVAAAGIKE